MPDYDISHLRDKISISMENDAKIAQLYSKAKALIDIPFVAKGMLDFDIDHDARNNLKDAYKQISFAQELNTNNPKIDSLLLMLDKKYASIVNSLVGDGHDEEASIFVADTTNYNWQGKNLARAARQISN